MTPAVKSFKQSVWGAMTPWMTSVAGAEKTATNNSAGAVKSYETSLFAEVHDLGDDFATAADDFVDQVLGDWLPYAQNVATAVAGAAHGGAGALDTLLTSLRTAGTTQAQDDCTSWKSYKLGIVGSEDALMTAYAADLKAQGVVAAVNNYDTIAATPLADFQFQIGQQTTAMPMGMGVMRPTSDDDYLAWADNIAATTAPPPPAAVVDLRSKVDAATKQQDIYALQQQRSSAFAAAQQALRDVENSWFWNRGDALAKRDAAMAKLNSIDAQLAALRGVGTNPMFAAGPNTEGVFENLPTAVASTFIGGQMGDSAYGAVASMMSTMFGWTGIPWLQMANQQSIYGHAEAFQNGALIGRFWGMANSLALFAHGIQNLGNLGLLLPASGAASAGALAISAAAVAEASVVANAAMTVIGAQLLTCGDANHRRNDVVRKG